MGPGFLFLGSAPEPPGRWNDQSVSASARPRRIRKVALSFALVWSVAVLVAGFTVPMYSEETETSSGSISGTDTLVGENGSGIIIVLLVPLVVSILVTLCLMARRVRGAIVVAWILTAALCGLTVLALLSIGIYLLPVAGALMVACAVEPAHIPDAQQPIP
jgi:hypothetical protein